MEERKENIKMEERKENVENTSITEFFQNTQNKIFITTKDLSDRKDKISLLNAMEESDELINNNLNKSLVLKDFYIEVKKVVDEETGEIKNKYRTIIFDEDGKSYASGSYGIYNILAKIYNIFGIEEIRNGIPVEIIKKKIGDGKTMLSLKVVENE